MDPFHFFFKWQMPHIRRRYKIFHSVENLKDANCSSKIHCQIDLLLIWSTFLQLSLTSHTPRHHRHVTTFLLLLSHRNSNRSFFAHAAHGLIIIILSHIFYVCASKLLKWIFLQHFITIDMTGALAWQKEKYKSKRRFHFFTDDNI